MYPISGDIVCSKTTDLPTPHGTKYGKHYRYLHLSSLHIIKDSCNLVIRWYVQVCFSSLWQSCIDPEVRPIRSHYRSNHTMIIFDGFWSMSGCIQINSFLYVLLGNIINFNVVQCRYSVFNVSFVFS